MTAFVSEVQYKSGHVLPETKVIYSPTLVVFGLNYNFSTSLRQPPLFTERHTASDQLRDDSMDRHKSPNAPLFNEYGYPSRPMWPVEIYAHYQGMPHPSLVSNSPPQPRRRQAPELIYFQIMGFLFLVCAEIRLGRRTSEAHVRRTYD